MTINQRRFLITRPFSDGRPSYLRWTNSLPEWDERRAKARLYKLLAYAERAQAEYGGEIVEVFVSPTGLPAITDFRGEYFFLSNFSPSLVYDWETVEHAFQAQKFAPGSIHRQRIAKLRTPAQAKQYAKAHKSEWRPDWFDVNVPIMADLVTQKFVNPRQRRLLLATGDAELVEGNVWGDVFWGVCNGEGQNRLGEILMAERARISERMPWCLSLNLSDE